MKKYRRLPAALVVACLALGMVAAPSALAAGKAQTAAKRVTVKSVNTKLNSTRKSLAKTTKSLGQLSARLKKGENSIALLLGAAPQLVDGLTKLSDAVQNQIAPGLLQLKAALEGDVSKALKETIPNAIKEVATSQEYGVTGVFVTLPAALGGTTSRAITFGSADIPDDGNTVAATGTLPVTATATLPPPAGQVPVDSVISLRSAIRSGETDGKATGDPAGQVGGLMYVKCATAPNCGVPQVPTGAIVCAVGPTPSSTFQTPAGPASLPLKTIQVAADRTDQTKPDGSSVNPLAGAPVSDGGSGIGDSTGGSCRLPAPGTYEVSVQTQFADIPTSKTPKATD